VLLMSLLADWKISELKEKNKELLSLFQEIRLTFSVYETVYRKKKIEDKNIRKLE